MSGVRMQVASRSGDMRRLLDACAAAVDLVVQEASDPQPEQANGMCSESCKCSDSLIVVLAGSCLWLMCMQHICTSGTSIPLSSCLLYAQVSERLLSLLWHQHLRPSLWALHPCSEPSRSCKEVGP